MSTLQDSNIVSNLIQKVYQAVLSPDDIHELINDVRHYIDAPYGAFQIENIDTHQLGDSYLINYDDSAISQYTDHYITKDPWTLLRLANNDLSTFFSPSHKHLSDKVYTNTEFYQDWGRHNGVRHAIGCSFDIGSQYMLKISFQRHDDQSQFSDEIENFLNLLQPHLARFVQLSSIFQQHHNNDITHMLHGLSRPVWIVNNKLEILFNNQPAQNWMSTGSHLTSRNSQLITAHPNQQILLQRQIDLITQLPHNPRLWNESFTDRNYEQITLGHPNQVENFWLTPIPNCQDPSQSVALVTGRKPLPNVEILQRVHGLSHRKAQLSLLLMQGFSIQESAQHLNISTNTVRNNLASCFRQLNVNNQVELVQHLFHTNCIANTLN